MGIVRKQSIIITLISYIGIALGSVVVLYFLPKYFTPEEIGIRNLVLEMAAMLSMLLAFSNHATFIKFYPKLSDDIQKSQLLIFCLLIPLIALFFSYLIYLTRIDISSILFAENSAAVLPYMSFCVAIAVLLIYITFYESYARMKNSYLIPKSTKEILLRMMAIGLIVLYGVGTLSFLEFWIWMSVSHVVVLLINILHVHYLDKLALSFKDWTKNFKNKEVLSFSGFTLLTNSGSILTLKFDTIMIASMIGLKETAVYTIAVFVVTVIETPKKAISIVIAPIISSAFSNNDIQTISTIYKKASVNQLIAGGYLFSGIWVNIDYLFQLMPNGELYNSGKNIILILGLAKLTDMLMSCNTTIIGFSEKYRFNLISILSLLALTVITNLVFIPKYGMQGAAIASMISISLFNVLQYFYIRHHFKMSPLSNKLIAPFSLIAIILFAKPFFPLLASPIWGIALNGTLISAVFLSLVLFTNSSEDMKDLIKKSVGNYFKK